MAIGLFLNPLARVAGGKRKKRRKKAAKKKRKRAKKKGRSANKGLMPLHTRRKVSKGVKMAKRRKKRGRKKKARKRNAVARPRKRRKKRRRNAVATNPRKRRKKRRRNAVARNPRRKKRRRRNALGLNLLPRRYRRRRFGLRRRNPVSSAVGMLKTLISPDAAKDYAYIGAGFVAGAIVPHFVVKGLQKAGILKAAVPSMAANIAIGVGSSIGTGLLVGMLTKDRRAAIKVTAGGLAGVLGSLAVTQLEKVLPLSGLGFAQAETEVRRAVEAEVRKSLGLGQFITSEEVAEAGEVAGTHFGQFVEAEDIETVEEVAGGGDFGQDIDEGAEAFDGFGDAGF